MEVHVRSEQLADIARIVEVTQLAFRNAAHTCGREHYLVDALRAAGALTLSLVAVSDEEIVGHVAVSPVTVSQSGGDWFGIGPLSVLPQCQRQGIGSRLMESVLSRLRATGARGCVLVGDPRFYTRLGFQSDGALVVAGVPAEVTLNLRFCQCDDRGTATFHPAFLAAMAEPGQAT
jgi:putative acetyltransferase